MGAGAVLPGGNISSAAATGLLLRRHGVSTGGSWGVALPCSLTAFGFAVNGVAGALLLAGVPDGPLDLSHAGIRIVVSVVVPSAAAMVIVVNRRFGVRVLRLVRGVAARLEGAWAAVMNPIWRLLGAVGFGCVDMAALLAACAASVGSFFLAVSTADRIGYLATAVPIPTGLGCSSRVSPARWSLHGLSAPAVVGAVLVYRAISI
jgi:hypothetical protein